jgi:hypothetical protein
MRTGRIIHIARQAAALAAAALSATDRRADSAGLWRRPAGGGTAKTPLRSVR